MDYSIYIDKFKVAEDEATKQLGQLHLPSSSATDEDEIYTNVELIRKERNELLRTQLTLRNLQRIFTKASEDQKDEDSVAVERLFRETDNLKGLKTKDERDMLIRHFVLKSRDSGTPDFERILERVNSVLGDVILAVSELQHCFDEYQLIYNFSRQASMGYLIAESRHKLNDVVSRAKG